MTTATLTPLAKNAANDWIGAYNEGYSVESGVEALGTLILAVTSPAGYHPTVAKAAAECLVSYLNAEIDSTPQELALVDALNQAGLFR